MTAWNALLTQTRPVFRAPSFAIFTELITGWVLAPGRRTVTAMITLADPAGQRSHDAFHSLVRDGARADERAVAAAGPPRRQPVRPDRRRQPRL